MQQHMTKFIKSCYGTDPGSSNKVTSSKHRDGIRMFLKNPNGVMKKDWPLENRRVLLVLCNCNADLIALLETNKKWKLNWVRNK